MRGIHGPSRTSASRLRRASALLAAGSLLSLFLSQPFHAPPPASGADGTPTIAAAPTNPARAPAEHAAHDADRCAQCRAFVKTRLGLRPPGLAALALDQPLFALHAPAPASPSAAADLPLAGPRAPPTA